LIVPEPPPIEEFSEEPEVVESGGATPTAGEPLTPTQLGTATSFSIQVATPDAASVSQAELSVSRISGVTSAVTTSLALGGTSVMRVTYTGDPGSLQAALQAQGWTVQAAGTTLRISRGGGG
jgi:hypothetical protein